MASAPRRFLGRVNLLCHPRARASFSLTRSAGAMRLDRIGPPGRCSGCWRRPRRSQLRGQLRHDPIAPGWLGGAPACFLSGISGWFSLSLGAWVPKNLARRKTRRLLTNRPCSSLVYEESDSKERLRVSNWIVQRLYNYAVKKTIEL